MKRLLYIPVAGLLVLALMASPARAQATASPGPFMVHFGEPGLDHEQVHQRVAVSMRVSRAISYIFVDATTWDEAHRAVQAALAAPPDLPDLPPAIDPAPLATFYSQRLEQRSAEIMLAQMLPRASFSPESQDQILAYAEVLIRHRSADLGLVVAALERLDRSVDPDARRELAARGVASGEALLARIADGSSDGRVTYPAIEAALLAAVDDLRRLASA